MNDSDVRGGVGIRRHRDAIEGIWKTHMVLVGGAMMGSPEEQDD